MTKANQVAPLLATVRGLISDATEAIDEFAKLAKYVDEVEARAEQAEYSLAASERALAALRDQVAVAGCECSTFGERTYNCRHDNLCGLCRLRHRAEQAERDRDAWRAKWEALETTRAVCCDQMERERDEARAELAAWHNIARSVGFAHEPYTGPVVVDAAARGAFADWCERNKEAVDGRAAAVDRLKYERDALQAKLAEAERMRDTLGRRIDEVQAALNECGAGFTGQKESTRIRALRAQLAKTEAVVEALPRCGHRFGCARRSTRSDGYTAFCDEHGGNWPLLPWHVALRALDAPDKEKTPGSSIGLPDAADAPQATAQPEQRSENPQDALGNGGARGPTYRAPNDSPVGVAATACDHKRQRCENDHAVCRDCGAVNRAVTGVADWGPPETAREDGSRGAVALCGEWLPAANSTCALPRGHEGIHDPWAPGVKSPTLREIHATTRREVEALRQAMITRTELDELRWRVERLENLTGSGSGSGSGSG